MTGRHVRSAGPGAGDLGTWAAIRLSLGIVIVTLGTLLLAASVPAALAAGAIEASVGRSGVVAQPLGDLRAPEGDIAVIVDGVSARVITPEAPTWVAGALALAGTDAARVIEDIGEVALVASPASGLAFLGVAPAETVNDYLDGTAYAVATSEAGAWPTVSVPGTGVPAAPEGQPWWVAQGAGEAPELPGEALDGLTLVLMRTDATPGPEAALRLEYRVPGADRALQYAAISAASAAAAGLMLVVLGGWLVVGLRRRDRA